MAIDVQGRVEPGFERVRLAFAQNFEQHGEVGAAFAAHVHGRPVVDIWSGIADIGVGTPWREDTLQLVYSTTKGATAICAHILAEPRELDLDSPVVRYWPEFAAHGKERIPAWLLSHRAGLRRSTHRFHSMTWCNGHRSSARSRRRSRTGNRAPPTGITPMTFGWLVGEVIRRVSGERVGAFFRNNVA